jgi:hypothetical protein
MFLFILGLLVTFGSVGTLDINPDANVLLQTVLALVGCALMYAGTTTMQGHNDYDHY